MNALAVLDTGDEPVLVPLLRNHARVRARGCVASPRDAEDMHRGDKATLRLTLGLGLARFGCLRLGLPAPYMVCLMSVLVLCKPGPRLAAAQGR